MLTNTRPTATPTERADQKRPEPSSSATRPEAPARRRFSSTSLWTTTALSLWLVYPVIVVLLPDAGLLRRAPTTPLTVLAGTWLVVLTAWTFYAWRHPASLSLIHI